jgi:hypothetical protein
MVFAVPPTVILVPTALAFGVEILAAGLGLAAVIALVMDGLVEPSLGLFDGMLALRVVIGAGGRRGCYEQPQSSRCYGRYRCLSYSLNQGFVLRFSSYIPDLTDSMRRMRAFRYSRSCIHCKVGDSGLRMAESYRGRGSFMLVRA